MLSSADAGDGFVPVESYLTSDRSIRRYGPVVAIVLPDPTYVAVVAGLVVLSMLMVLVVVAGVVLLLTSLLA